MGQHKLLIGQRLWLNPLRQLVFYFSPLDLKIVKYNQHSKKMCPALGRAVFDLLTAVSSEKKQAMAPHSSTLAWKFPWAEEPGGLQSMGSRRVGHD